MITIFISSLVAPLLIGYFMVLLFWRSDREESVFAIKLILGFCIGMTIISMIYFLVLSFLIHFIAYVFVIEWILIFLLLYILKRNRIEIFSYHFHLPKIKRSLNLDKIFFCILLYGFIMSLLSLIYLAYYQSYGQGDAWAIWNLKARFIYRDAGIFWKNLYCPIIDWSHPNYPLMLPISVARIWAWGHVENIRAPMYLAVVFSYAIVIFLYASINYMRGRLNAILATLTLISTPFFLTHGTSQYADVVLSFFYLATLILINHIGENNNHKQGMIMLMGLVCSMTCWIKNEGLLFFLAVFLSTALVLRKKILLFFLGALPVFIILSVHNFFVAGQNMSVPYNLTALIARLFDYSRHFITIKKFIVEIFSFGQWKVNPWLLLIFILIFFKKKIISKEAIYFRLQTFIMLLTMGLYYLTYILSSFALDWYLERSLNRLLIQLWPCFIYLFFLKVKISLEYR